jgi:thiosulfate dehydrogenase
MRFFRMIVLFALAGGCSQSALQYGQSLFHDPAVSDSQPNVFACSTCHDTTTTPSGLRPGYTLFDAAARPVWWGGFSTSLLDALNQCVNYFMDGTVLADDDPKGEALHLYLESIAPDMTSPALPLTVVTNIVDVPSGDPAQGKALWDTGCAICHGAPHTGQGRITPLASLVPDDSISAHGTDPLTGARPVVIEKVRHGKFFMVGGKMPLFSLEALPDAQLGSILGYLETFGLPPYVPPMM